MMIALHFELMTYIKMYYEIWKFININLGKILLGGYRFVKGHRGLNKNIKLHAIKINEEIFY